jgi:adenylate kinase family enzyme
MKRVMIIGSNGAGKSTFSYELSKRTKLPLVHIDKIYWRNRWEVTPKEEFDKIVMLEAQKPNWIMEGNNIRSINQRLQYADTVIWFEFSPILCIFNIVKREIKYRNQVRPDMPDECVSQFNMKFLREVWRFNQINHTTIEKILKSDTKIQVIRFTNYRKVRDYLRNM